MKYRNRDSFSNFDRKFKIMQTIFWIFFGLVSLIILGSWMVGGILAVHVANDPNGAAREAGNLVKTFLDAAGLNK